MEPSALHLSAGLEPYAAALDRRRLSHLLRRAQFGAWPAQIDEHAGKTASQVVDTLIDGATNPAIVPLPVKPAWADNPVPDRTTDGSEVVRAYKDDNKVWLRDYRSECILQLRTGGLREKMTLFWHNHFVTQAEVYDYAVYTYRYLEILRGNALGDYRQMVQDIGLTPAMLIYLNGDLNEEGKPNENYARELLELFTMGPEDADGNPNYTQTDVEEIARALTGYKVDDAAISHAFESKDFDDGSKTIFGQTGNYGYDDVIDLIFAHRAGQTAYFICAQIYREFVHEDVDRAIVEELAAIFLANDWQVEPVVSTLLKSSHFFEESRIGARVKSPLELGVGLVADTNTVPTIDTLNEYEEALEALGQYILDPPDVGGWRGFRAWLSTDTLPGRWELAEQLLTTANGGSSMDVVSYAQTLPEATDVLASFKLPLRIAEHLLAVPLEKLDVYDVDEDFAGDLLSNPVPVEILEQPAWAVNLAKIFLSGVPWYEFSVYSSGADSIITDYLRFLTKLPEFQLG